MGTKSRTAGRGGKRKGDAYERELAKFLNGALFGGREQVTRAPLSGGGRTFSGAGDADLNGTPVIHVEAKRVEKVNVREAMLQAENSITQRASKDLPVVITRKNGEATGESLVVLRLSDFLTFYRAELSRLGFVPHADSETPLPEPD